MKRLINMIIGLLILTGVNHAAFVPLSEDQRQQVADNPGMFAKFVKGANPTELAQATAQTLRTIEVSDFGDTIRQRMVAVVSAAIAEAGEDAPKVAVAAMEAVSNEHKPIVSAAAFIVSGRHAPQVRKELLDAAYGQNKEMIRQALDNPISLALGNDLARVATHYAVSALVPKTGSTSASASVGLYPKRRVTQLVNPNSVDLSTGSTASSTTSSSLTTTNGIVNCVICACSTSSFFQRAEFYTQQIIVDPDSGRSIAFGGFILN